jgi:hypothetical protein
MPMRWRTAICARRKGHNEAVLLAGIADGKHVSAADIQHLADTQQISAGGVEALTSANVRAENGVDKPDQTLRLWHAVNTKQATSGMIFDALHNGDISRNTSVTMMRALDSKRQQAGKRGRARRFAQVKTALNGGAIDQGIIKDATPKALWAQAQNEWTSGSRIGGESPLTVKDDILKRYAAEAAVPTWLPQPSLGMVRRRRIWRRWPPRPARPSRPARSVQAQFDEQLRLLSQYKSYYPLQMQDQAARGPEQRHEQRWRKIRAGPLCRRTRRRGQCHRS